MLQTSGDRTVSSEALRAFVKLHEDKLNAKIHDMRANRRRARVQPGQAAGGRSSLPAARPLTRAEEKPMTILPSSEWSRIAHTPAPCPGATRGLPVS